MGGAIALLLLCLTCDPGASKQAGEVICHQCQGMRPDAPDQPMHSPTVTCRSCHGKADGSEPQQCNGCSFTWP